MFCLFISNLCHFLCLSEECFILRTNYSGRHPVPRDPLLSLLFRAEDYRAQKDSAEQRGFPCHPSVLPVHLSTVQMIYVFIAIESHLFI